ncbi:MAG: FAD-dependent oxidoreductase, partial [Acidobacteria bacterium]|nr:FAD-dependent oxidoreductase [Acidobacteriota bacterium]
MGGGCRQPAGVRRAGDVGGAAAGGCPCHRGAGCPSGCSGRRRQVELPRRLRAPCGDAGEGRPGVPLGRGGEHPRQGHARPHHASGRRGLPAVALRHEQGLSVSAAQDGTAGLRSFGDPPAQLGVHGALRAVAGQQTADRAGADLAVVTEHHDVVVVGAGLAGLRCAVDLASAGADVVVLEARHRVGGRVFSHRFAEGQWCERGAEFIDANHTEVLALAAELGLQVTERDGELAPTTALVDAAGRAVPMHLHASLVDDLRRWEQALDGLKDEDGFENATLDDLMRSLGLSAVSRLVIGRDIRTEYMLPPDSVSQRYAAHLVSVQRPGLRERHRVVGGLDQLATGLAGRLGHRVRLGTAVGAIEAESGTVTTADSAITADSVVAAVPLPVLSRLWREMPPELGAVGYGIGGKISI